MLDLRIRALEIRRRRCDVLFAPQHGFMPAQLAEQLLPDALPLGGVRSQEFEGVAHPAHAGGVDILLPVGRQNDDPAICLDQLEQVVRIGIGAAAVRIPDLGAAAEERVRLVEEQYAVHLRGAGKDLGELYCRLADVRLDHGGKVDADKM